MQEKIRFMKSVSSKVMVSMWLLLITTVIMLASNLGVVEADDPNGLQTYTDSIIGLKYSVNFIWTLLGVF